MFNSTRQAILVIAMALTASALAAQQKTFAGDWKGAIDLPDGGALEVIVHLTAKADTVSGTIDVPSQGATALTLGDFKVKDETIQFMIMDVPGEPTFVGLRKEDKIEGTFMQGGANLTFHLALVPPAPPVEKKP